MHSPIFIIETGITGSPDEGIGRRSEVWQESFEMVDFVTVPLVVKLTVVDLLGGHVPVRICIRIHSYSTVLLLGWWFWK